MTLTLRAVSHNDQPLTQPITARFDREGGTIGRADDNTMPLPDPERYISRQQAEIRAGAGGYTIRNIGSANPIVVRNQPLARGESAQLSHSDQVRIGGYLLEVIDDDAQAGAQATTIMGDRTAVDAAAGAALPARERDGVHPFALPAAPPAASQNFGDLISSALTPFIDEPFAQPGGASSAPLAGFLDDAASATPGYASDGAPSLPEGPADAAALGRAFCEGAGIRLDPAQAASPQTMRVVGQLLHAAVEGALQLMALRSATRQEMHAHVTVIRSRNNNPLKFSPDAQSALEQLLQPSPRGFLRGSAAMADAMNDLVGHAIGTMAGTRAALEGMLERFEPRQLEARLAGRTMLDRVLPMSRKARLWELYLQHHGRIRDEAHDEFHALFGRTFLAAYEQQLERLRRDRNAANS